MESASLAIGGDTSPLKAALSKAGTVVRDWGRGSRKSLSQVGTDIKTFLQDKALNAVKALERGLNKIADEGGIFPMVGRAAKKAGQSIKDALSYDVGQGVQQTFDRAALAVEDFSERAQEAIAKIFGAVGMAIETMMDFVEGAMAAFKKVTSALLAPFTALGTAIKGVFSGMVSAISTVFSKISSLVTGLASRIYDGLVGAFQAVSDLAPLWGASVAAGLAVGFGELSANEKALARMKGLIRSTGGAAGYTAEQLQTMADQMAAASGSFGGDDFGHAIAGLLQFRNIRGDVFKSVAKTAEDMAVANGDSLAGAMDKLGRSIDDPVRGVRMLQSEGIHFTETEYAMIRAMMANGKAMEAQRMVLDRVRETYKGNAAVMGNTFTGKVHKLTEALKNQWTAFATALTPAIEAVIPYLIKGANSSQKMAESLGVLVKATVDWAQKSVGVITEWYNYAVKIFADASMWIIDRFADAFAFVQTAVQDMPKFFEMSKAKIAVIWEELTQSLSTVWENVTVSIQNTWIDAINAMRAPFIDFVAFVQKSMITLDEMRGKLTNKQAEWAREAVDSAANIAKKFARPNVKAKGPSDEDKERLEKLKATYAALSGDFSAAFGKNLGKNKGFFDSVKAQLKAAIMQATGVDIEAAVGDPTKSNRAFLFNKDSGEESGGGSKGAFEDLMSLQKRIASAAFKDPAATATMGQTAVIKQNFQEWKKMKQEERKLQQEAADANKAFNKKFDQMVAAGETLG